jgi:hypothetical protein
VVRFNKAVTALAKVPTAPINIARGIRTRISANPFPRPRNALALAHFMTSHPNPTRSHRIASLPVALNDQRQRPRLRLTFVGLVSVLSIPISSSDSESGLLLLLQCYWCRIRIRLAVTAVYMIYLAWRIGD